METEYIITWPVITDASFSTNPVEVSQVTLISVGVREDSKTLYAEARKCNEFFVGEI